MHMTGGSYRLLNRLLPPQTVLERAGVQDFADPESVLDALDDALHKQYEITNDNIRAGDNPHVQFKKNGLFSITNTSRSRRCWRR